MADLSSVLTLEYVEINPMSVIPALLEWHDARKALFDASSTIDAKGAKPLWERLAKAEHSLMDVARGIKATPVSDVPEDRKSLAEMKLRWADEIAGKDAGDPFLRFLDRAAEHLDADRDANLLAEMETQRVAYEKLKDRPFRAKSKNG